MFLWVSVSGKRDGLTNVPDQNRKVARARRHQERDNSTRMESAGGVRLGGDAA